MNIQPMGADCVALYLTAEDLAPYGASPHTLTLEQARRLTEEACAAAGLWLEGAVEIEAFPERRGVMLFVHALERFPSRPIPRRPMRKQRVRRYST